MYTRRPFPPTLHCAGCGCERFYPFLDSHSKSYLFSCRVVEWRCSYSFSQEIPHINLRAVLSAMQRLHCLFVREGALSASPLVPETGRWFLDRASRKWTISRLCSPWQWTTLGCHTTKVLIYTSMKYPAVKGTRTTDRLGSIYQFRSYSTTLFACCMPSSPARWWRLLSILIFHHCAGLLLHVL